MAKLHSRPPASPSGALFITRRQWRIRHVDQGGCASSEQAQSPLIDVSTIVSSSSTRKFPLAGLADLVQPLTSCFNCLFFSSSSPTCLSLPTENVWERSQQVRCYTPSRLFLFLFLLPFFFFFFLVWVSLSLNRLSKSKFKLSFYGLVNVGRALAAARMRERRSGKRSRSSVLTQQASLDRIERADKSIPPPPEDSDSDFIPDQKRSRGTHYAVHGSGDEGRQALLASPYFVSRSLAILDFVDSINRTSKCSIDGCNGLLAVTGVTSSSLGGAVRCLVSCSGCSKRTLEFDSTADVPSSRRTQVAFALEVATIVSGKVVAIPRVKHVKTF